MTNSDVIKPETKPGKEPKAKPTPRLRRPDELFRTLFTRLTVRRQPFLYLGFNEADNEFVTGTTLEDDLLYGDPLFAQSLLRIHDPELLTSMQDLLRTIGYVPNSETNKSYYIDVRDLGSFLNKFKTPDEYPVEKNEDDQWWYMVKKKQKKEEGGKTIDERKYIREPTVTQFRFACMNTWREHCSRIMDNNGTFWRVPFQDNTEQTTVLVKWAADEVSKSPIGDKHPHGLKTVLTRGYDFLETKFLERSKYDIDAADLVFWIESGSAVRMAHHIKLPEFEMITTRPYGVLF